MKASWKVSLTAIMVGALALVLVLGAGIGSATPATDLADDIVLVGNGGTGQNNIRVIDISSGTIVRTISSPSLANNHGVLVDSSGRYLYNSNAAVSAGNMKIVKFDLGTLSEVGAYTQYITGMTAGLCGIEWQQNDPDSGIIWTADMDAGTTRGGLYEFNANTNSFTGGYIDATSGATTGQTCGIGWNSSNSYAYSALMQGQKAVRHNWPAASIDTEVATPTWNHMLDTAKTGGYAYVAGHKDSTGAGKIYIFNMASMTLVSTVTTGGNLTAPHQIHDVRIAHSERYMYVHSREGNNVASPSLPGQVFVFDLVDDGDNTQDDGASLTNPVLIQTINAQTTGSVACGTELLSKADYCGAPSLSLTKNSVYWGPNPDYSNGVLSVDYTVNNNGTAQHHAYDVTVVGAVNTNGVTLNTVAPVGLGNIAVGGSANMTLKYNVGAATAFNTTVYATAKDLCNNTHAYPGPYPGP